MNGKLPPVPSNGRRRGQVVVLMAGGLVVLLGFLGLVVDVGRTYVAYRQLQASTDAAALAGAELLPTSSASATAVAYSSVAGNNNAFPSLPNVSMAAGYPALKCLATLTSQGIPCSAPANANAIAVRQQATVPMYFAKLFGMKSLTLTSTATGGKGGTTIAPYNVAVLLDTTASMNTTDNGTGCKNTRIACAVQGVQALLSGLSPCGTGLSSCGSTTKNSSGGGANVNNAIDKVALYTFPSNTTASASSDYTCQGSVNTQAYSFSGPSPSYLLPTTSTYQIVNFSSDYRSSDSATALSSSSNLVAAVGATSKSSGCTKAVGGYGTYYAQSIYQVQADLAAQKALNPSSENVMIILSDGDASASAGSKGLTPTGVLTKSGTYPSAINQCQQAITAAKAAIAAGTTVYTVAYGAASSGCSTDGGKVTPCTTMQQMASNANTFFSDYASTQNPNQCISASRPTSNLNAIFNQIAQDFSGARLLPDNTP